MDLDFAVNGIALRPGQDVSDHLLQRAGLVRLAGWRCFLRRLNSGLKHWEAINPRIVCFDGQMDIFACNDRYLDPDRKWKTALLLGESAGRVQCMEIRIIDGVYAAGNYYSGFLDLACDQLGEPGRNGRRNVGWSTDSLRIEAVLSADALNAVFRIAWQPATSTSAKVFGISCHDNADKGDSAEAAVKHGSSAR